MGSQLKTQGTHPPSTRTLKWWAVRHHRLLRHPLRLLVDLTKPESHTGHQPMGYSSIRISIRTVWRGEFPSLSPMNIDGRAVYNSNCKPRHGQIGRHASVAIVRPRFRSVIRVIQYMWKAVRRIVAIHYSVCSPESPVVEPAVKNFLLDYPRETRRSCIYLLGSWLEFM